MLYRCTYYRSTCAYKGLKKVITLFLPLDSNVSLLLILIKECSNILVNNQCSYLCSCQIFALPLTQVTFRFIDYEIYVKQFLILLKGIILTSLDTRL